jgi:hypothetical protein
MNFEKMNKLNQIEHLIIFTLWLTIFATYPYALLNNYNLFLSDYLGLAGLTILTAVSFYNPKWTFKGLLILLFLGMFNAVSFIYFVNVVLTFGFSTILTPGIQLLSFILLVILASKRIDKFSDFWKRKNGQTAQEITQLKQHSKQRFKLKFNRLTNEEIENKLKDSLVEEAKEALVEIQIKRTNDKQTLR